MTLEMMKNRRNELGWTLQELSERSGVPIGTVQKIFSGTTGSPRYKTLQALEQALGGVLEQGDYGLAQPEETIVAEEQAVYGSSALKTEKKQGEYTVEDYLALPEEQRVELIDGVFYDMAAPFNTHQVIAAELFRQIANFIRDRGGACKVFISPADVQLDRDNRTMVQPDVFIVCDRDKLNRKRTFGAPDFVVEVLSDSTRSKDMLLKLRKYQAAGVREYWIIDPDRRKVIVHLFDEGFPDTFICGFDAQVPVHVLKDECLVDFREVWDAVAFLYEEEQE